MNTASGVPGTRIRLVNAAPVRPDRTVVLYWMTANRRLQWNFALQRAVDRARELGLPLVILEALRADYAWASDRFHRFVLDGMVETHDRLADTPVGYYPYVEPEVGAGKKLLEALAARAAVVVTDDTPAFFYPRMVAAAAAKLDVALEAVDSAGLLPFRSTDRAFPTAYSFRRFLQRELPPHLEELPRADPLEGPDPAPAGDVSSLAAGFTPTPARQLRDAAFLSTLPIDHTVDARRTPPGGSNPAQGRLHRFVEELLPGYGERRNHPDGDHTSELSAYLHFGHISSHQVFATIAGEQLWSPARLGTKATGARQGWWGMSTACETFLDQLVTWRELGLNMCHHRSDYTEYSSLPDWARATLDEHRADERPHVYDLARFEAATTHDEIWNAAQNQLATEGRMHNYLRMLWGKKILEWSATPEAALEVMIELNNKYALDGRDPNSYSGIFWVMGRYDRPWGPERPIFGKVRYMSSANTARKLRLGGYLHRYSGQPKLALEETP